ncbi:putative phosphoprotein metallophosphatase [Bodo saltans virus]|uniref:Serine/threonine-protein phosphatase n=1 Tax=Bodo saltans virus TaxID=2024608 RepID=A0A2H4UTN3_9VIRU|nr:putative phosphoprotein metallophosphatase [Bodo saltans virus]ATZ80248.1 putative phosphoprotein metallophosphatase [Bodo saltans virus]
MSEVSLNIFDYKLKNYSKNLMLDNDGLFEYKTMSIEDINIDDDKCNIIDVDNNNDNDKDTESSDIRTCDYITGKIKKAAYNEKINDINIDETSNLYFEMKYDDFIITSNDLIKFININGAKKSKLSTINFDDIPDNMKKIYDANISTLLKKALTIIKQEYPNESNTTNTTNTYVAWIKPEQYDKTILIGDVHGSLSTIIRHLLRLRKLNILDKNCKIKNGYRMIFLGDIVDRGIYAFEILIVLYMLKLLNPSSLYLNRGNHEEMDVNKMYGFEKEVKHKIGDNYNDIYLLFNTIMSYESSAIVLENPYNDKENVYLCHGGLPHNLDNSDLLADLFIDGIATKKSFLINDEHGRSIRWNDIYGYDKTINNLARLGSVDKNDSPCRVIKIIGNNLIEEAKKNGICLVIRGHQDSFHNTKLMQKDTNEWISIKQYTKKKYPKKKLKCKGSIFNISLNNNKNLVINNDTEYMKDLLIPVVTISTNTDFSRNLNSDSCAILEFTDEKQMPNCQVAGSIHKKKFFKYTNKIYEIFANVKL